MTKICDSCSFELELTNFRTRKYRNGGSGILNICRACERRKNMEYYERNKEENVPPPVEKEEKKPAMNFTLGDDIPF